MGRVETRMYKRRRRRKRRLRWMALVLLLGLAALLIWRSGHPAFLAEWIGEPSPTQKAAKEVKETEVREVTLAAETWYAIQTGVFSTREAAEQKADAYTERGAPGTVIQDGEKWRVFIACYGTEGEASAVRTRLETNQQVDTYLYAWSCPELRMRLTGLPAQLDTAEAGFTLLISTAAALRDTATELDAAQLTTQEVTAAVAALDSQITLWEETVRSRFGKAVPLLLQGMMDVTAAWDERCSALQACEGATALSAELKKQGMGMFDEICAWRRKLAAQ